MAGVLLYDGIDDKDVAAAIAGTLQTVSGSAFTYAWLGKRSAVGGGLFDGIAYLMAASTIQSGWSFNALNQIQLDYGSGRVSTSTFGSTTEALLLVLSVAAGTATPRLGLRRGVGGSMSHENLSGTQAKVVGTATSLVLGSWKGTADFSRAYHGLHAIWSGEMSDANKALLGTNWRTSDVWSSAHGTPLMLAEQNTITTVDLAGNATSWTLTGAAVSAGETLDSWNFDGVGAVASSTFYFPVRIPNPHVGPVALRQQFHRAYWPQGISTQTVPQAITATVTTTATITRQIGKAVTANATVAASIVKSVGKTVTGTATTTATMVRQAGKRLTATVTTTATVQALKAVLLTITATVTTTASMRRQTGKNLSATATTTASIRRQINTTLSATATMTATVTKRVGVTLTATVTTLGSLVAQFISGSAVVIVSYFGRPRPGGATGAAPAEAPYGSGVADTTHVNPDQDDFDAPTTGGVT